jgi:hypothetical protein
MQVKSGVLIVHSYHKGFTWTDNIEEGICNTIPNLEGFNDKEIFIEYMDAKRNNNSTYYQQLFKIWELKYKNVFIPVIITSDDIAFQQMIKIRPQLFPEASIVFCGVNNLADYKVELLKKEPKITGVVEGFDLQKTIELALIMHKQTKQVFIINDNSPTGKANKKAFLQVLPKLPQTISYQFLSSFSMKDVRLVLDTLPAQSIVLLLSYNKDLNGDYYSYQEAGKIICSNTQLPVYAVWDFYLGTGIVGGCLVSGKLQGQKAALLANEILLNKSADSIAIIEKSPN